MACERFELRRARILSGATSPSSLIFLLKIEILSIEIGKRWREREKESVEENTGGRVKQDNKSGWRREVYDRMEREARPGAVFDLQESLYLHFTLSQRDTAKTVRAPCTICLSNSRLISLVSTINFLKCVVALEIPGNIKTGIMSKIVNVL